MRAVTLMKVLLRVFAFLYHAGLTIFLLAVSGLAISSRSGELNLRMLPWTGDTLAFILFFGSLFGLLSLILALSGKMPYLFFLWSLAVAIVLIDGYFFGHFSFHAGEFKTAVYLILGSWLALIGAWPLSGRPRF